jgi:hypothetical protein
LVIVVDSSNEFLKLSETSAPALPPAVIPAIPASASVFMLNDQLSAVDPVFFWALKL